MSENHNSIMTRSQFLNVHIQLSSGALGLILVQAFIYLHVVVCASTKGSGKTSLLRKLRPSGPEVIKLFSCSTQLSTKFILLINVKMSTIVGILTFISMINTTSERLKGVKARNFFICRYSSFNEQLKFRAQLS